MGFIALIILGLIAGAIAKAIMPGKDPGGMIVTMLIGIAGSIIGGLLGGTLLGYGGVNDAGDVSRPGFFMRLVLAVVGALILLAIYRLIKGRSVRA
ncbi:MAG TPA: GlsB/YeaQ/YmgE family stress response membrane protein [Pyrinomonadaceae bacterium]|jgi:uncharacterized membrane protein YeaQ/YmgE (transglycosylase-associated protein family)